MPNMLTISDLHALVPSTCGVDGSVLQPLIDAANKTAEAYCNRQFYLAQTFTKYYDLPPPGQRNEIPLSERPINSITSVAIDGNGGYGQLNDTFGSDTLLTAGEDYYFQPGTDILTILQSRSNWPAWGTFAYGGYGYPFGVNRRNARQGCVKIVFNAGWTEYPADLKMAIAQLVSWLYGGAMESGGRGAVTTYIDVSIGSNAAMDALAYGNVPALGTTRDILNRYREIPVVSAGRW